MSSLYKGYAKLITGMNKLLDIITIGLMLIMIALVAYQVFMRQVLDNAPGWTEEVAMMLMAWFAYLGIAIGLQENLHIGIEMLVNKFPRRVRQVIEVVNNLVILVLAVLLLHFGHSLAWFVRHNSLPATGWSTSWYYWPLAFAGGLMLLIVLGKLAAQLIEQKETETHE